MRTRRSTAPRRSPAQQQPEQSQSARRSPCRGVLAGGTGCRSSRRGGAHPQASPAEHDAPVRQAPPPPSGTEATKAPRTADSGRPQGQALVVVRFASDSEARTESQDALARRGRRECMGHRLSSRRSCDNRGPKRWNEVLSELARVPLCATSSPGDPATRISVQGFGSSQPARATTPGAAARANRRVEVRSTGAD